MQSRAAMIDVLRLQMALALLALTGCTDRAWPISGKGDPAAEWRVAHAGRDGDGGRMELFCSNAGIGVVFSVDGASISSERRPVIVRLRFDGSKFTGARATAEGRQIGFAPGRHSYEEQVVRNIEAGASTMALELYSPTGLSKFMSFDLEGGRKTVLQLRERCGRDRGQSDL